LQQILDSFEDTEFWYAENIPGNFRTTVPRKDEKWWLQVRCVTGRTWTKILGDQIFFFIHKLFFN